ncbi:hypothetical protein MCEREM21A_02335 [Sphingomonadaceae bacterium]
MLLGIACVGSKDDLEIGTAIFVLATIAFYSVIIKSHKKE